jgi:hypothetical protein
MGSCWRNPCWSVVDLKKDGKRVPLRKYKGQDGWGRSLHHSVQVGPESLLKAAEGYMALTIKYLMVVTCRHLEQFDFLCVIILGFYMYYTVDLVVLSLIPS